MADKRGGGGDGGDSRRKKAKYMHGGASGAALPHGATGILVSCDANKDRVTCAQLSDFLTEVWNELCPLPADAAAAAAAAAPAGGSVDALLAAEVAGLKEKGAQRFLYHEAGTKGLAFLRLHPAAAAPRGAPSATALVHAAMQRVRDTAHSRAKFAHRVLPVEAVCFASAEDIAKAAAPLLAAAFPADVDAASALKYAVVFESRSCDGLKLERKAVIDALAALVPKPHSVDLNNPERVIMVQVIKSVAALAVLPEYYALCKYNLRTLITPPEARAPASAVKGSGVSKPKPAAPAAAAAAEEGTAAAAAPEAPPAAEGAAAADA